MRDAWQAIYDNLDEKEQEAYKKFCLKHKKHGMHVSGNGISAEVSPDTIGGYTIVMKCSCGKTKNITNFDNW